jgi:RNA 2',3'-cyclic 3'-phosphodiesterase
MAEGRYFFALWPDAGVRGRIMAAATQAPVRGRLHQAEDLHMTLVFLGQLAESQLRCVYETADRIRCSAFKLAMDHTGYWSRPRILWAAPTQTPAPLSQLVFDLKEGLKACGFEPERRAYQPHVTLYRKAVEVVTGEIEPCIEWPVSEFVLAVSGGGAPGSPRYQVLRRWPMILPGS